MVRIGRHAGHCGGGHAGLDGVARAFLADAPILILGEATSSLDSASEGAIQDAMLRLMEGRTAVVVAHCQSMARDHDRIPAFDRGRLVEEGTRTSLLTRDGADRRSAAGIGEMA